MTCESKKNQTENKLPTELHSRLSPTDPGSFPNITAKIREHSDPPPVKKPVLIRFPASHPRLKPDGKGGQFPQVQCQEISNSPALPRKRLGQGLRGLDLNGFRLYKVFKRNSLSGMFMMLENDQISDDFIDAIRRNIDGFRLLPRAGGEGYSPVGQDFEGLTMSRLPTVQTRALADEVARRKEVEEQLRESQKSFRLALDTSFNGVWDFDLVRGVLNFGENWYRNVGHQKYREATDTQGWRLLIHPDDLEKVLTMHRELAEGVKTHAEIEFRIQNPAGGWYWLLSRGRILTTDDKGKVLRIIGIDTDITRLKQIESELRKAGTEQERQIREKTAELNSMHIALEILLQDRKTDRAALASCITSSICKLIEPLLASLEEGRLNEQQKLYLGTLRYSIKELPAMVADTPSNRLVHLSLSEFQIADLVHPGRKTKEIARML